MILMPKILCAQDSKARNTDMVSQSSQTSSENRKFNNTNIIEERRSERLGT